MAEVLSPPATTSPPSHPSDSSSSSDPSITLPHPRSQPDDSLPNHTQHRKSSHSLTSAPSRTQSTAIEYPAFASSLPYTLVRDFAYPVFHPMHYGAALEGSGISTPTSSDWNPARRQSDPMDQWHNTETLHHGGWSAGIWGGDGGMPGDYHERDLYDDHDDYDDDDRHDEGEHDGIAALPSTSFSSTADQNVLPLEFAENEGEFKKGKHRKSKSYGSIGDFHERGRRRESGRRSRGDGADAKYHYAQQTPNTTADAQQQQQQQQQQRGSLGRSTTAAAAVESNGERRDSRYNATLSNLSFQHHNSHSHSHPDSSSSTTTTTSTTNTEDPIPLDAEPNTTASPHRSSMSPEDEELFAGPSLALYAFEPENSNELRLEEGQEIMVSYRHGQGWLVASDPLTGEQGLVPEAYVRLIADMPNYVRETGEWIDVEEFEGEEDGEGWGDDEEHEDHERRDPLTAQKRMESAFGEESEGHSGNAVPERGREGVS